MFVCLFVCLFDSADAGSFMRQSVACSVADLPMPSDPIRSKSIEILTRAMLKNSPESDRKLCQSGYACISLSLTLSLSLFSYNALSCVSALFSSAGDHCQGVALAIEEDIRLLLTYIFLFVPLVSCHLCYINV